MENQCTEMKPSSMEENEDSASHQGPVVVKHVLELNP